MTKDLTRGTPWKLIVQFALPIMLGNLLQQLYNTADTIIVGNFDGQQALSSVGACTSLTILFTALALGFSIGADVLISQYFGAGRMQELRRYAATSIVLMLAMGLVMTMVGVPSAELLLRGFLGTPESLLPQSVLYFRIYAAGLVFQFGYNIAAALLRALGDSRATLYFLLVSSVLNVVLDLLFVAVCGMGVAGAAYATVGGQILSMIVGLCILFFGNHAIALEFKGFRFHGKTMKDIYVVGLPSIVMNAIGTLMTMAMNGILAGFSAVAVNVFGVYFKLQSFVFMPVFGLTQGLMPIMGYNYGARNKKRVTGAVKIGCVIALIIEIAGLIVFEICPGTLISIFNATPELHEIGDSALRIIAIHFPMAAIGITLSTLFQATGHGMYSLVQSVMRQLVVLVPVAWLLSKISLGAVWFCFPISEFISLIVTVVFFVILYNKEIKNLDKPVNSAAATESVKG